MKLSNEDKQILELEKKIQNYQRLTVATNNAEPHCTKYHNKAMTALREQTGLLYNRGGEYRRDKKHLLVPNSGYLNLDLLLLDELYSFTEKENEGVTLTEKEQTRYIEIIDKLHSRSVEIPFGISI